MFDDIKKILKKNYKIKEITLNTNFKTDLGLTSFDFVNLIVIIEDLYNIEIEENKYRALNTIKDLITYLESKKC